MKGKGIFQIIVLSVLGVLLIASCDLNPEEKNLFKGIWKTSQGYTVTFKDSTWELPYYSGGELVNIGLKGTYTYSDKTANIKYTDVSPDGITWRPITSLEISSYNLVNIATISGNTLTWGISTYYKQ